MRNIFLSLGFIISCGCFGQNALTGQILSIVDSLPVSGCSITYGNKNLITADSSGIFTISTSRRKIRLTIASFPNPDFDTLVKVKSFAAPIKLFVPPPFGSALALYHIRQNKIQLFCGGGFAPLASMPADKDFETQYAVKYWILDCRMPEDADLQSYNKTVADFLDKKYGKEWRQKVRPDVFFVTK
jgi:hypothetical protein